MNRRTLVSAGVYTAIAAGIFTGPVPFVKTVLPFLLGTVLFMNFMQLRFIAGHFLRRELLAYPLFSLFLFPAAFMLLSAGMDPSLRAGLLIITVTPTAIGAPVMASLINADSGLVLSQVLLSNIFAPLIYPAAVMLYLGKTGIEFSPSAIFRQVFFIVLLPLALSLVFRNWIRFKKMTDRITPYAVPPVFILMIFAAVSSSSSHIRNVPAADLFRISASVFCAAGVFFSTGLIFIRKRKIWKAVSLMLGHKNTGLAVWIALTGFSENAVLPLILYIIFHHVFNGLLIFVSSRLDGRLMNESV